jgi:type IV fimbrial biogenesis protein FimT
VAQEINGPIGRIERVKVMSSSAATTTHCERSQSRRSDGFTLLELLVALSVVSLLVGIAVPGFVDLIRNSRTTTLANDLVASVNIARSEAVQRGRSVTLCSSTDGQTCGGNTDWSSGWVVLNSLGQPVHVWPGLRDAGVLTGTTDLLEFHAGGWIVAAGADFTLRFPECRGEQGRDLSVNTAGRVAVSREAC